MVNRVSSYFPKGGHSATRSRTKNNMNIRQVKSDTKNRQQRITSVLVRSHIALGLAYGDGVDQLDFALI